MIDDGTGPTNARPSLLPSFLEEIDHDLAGADALLAGRYPGDPGTRQPVHTVYVNADLVRDELGVGLLDRWAAGAREVLAVAAADTTAAAALGCRRSTRPCWTRCGPSSTPNRWRTCAWTSRTATETGRTRRRTRPPRRPRRLLRSLLEAPGGPAFAGIRFKCLEAPTRRRGLRTLDLVVAGLLADGPACRKGSWSPCRR